MGRAIVAMLLVAATFAVVSAGVTRHPNARTISAIDVASGERVTSFVVVLDRSATVYGISVPLTRRTLDMFLAARLPSFSIFTARQTNEQYIYNSRGFVGFSAMLSASEVAVLASDPSIAYIEEDMVIELDHIQRDAPTANITVPTWGTDRSDQRALPLDKIYKLPITKEEIVAVPNVYVVDTGVNTKHIEFGGRAVLAKNFYTDGKEDCNGHGTHVSGSVGGVNTGIAPFVNIFGIRIFDCTGSTTLARVIAGIDFVIDNHVKPAVLTMSLGGGFSQALNDATTAALDAGIPTTIASGNSADDACDYSPASTPGAITVNSMNVRDQHSSFSNYGECTVVYGPGEAVVSAWWTGPSDYNTISGTSMATPHIAGVAALFLARKPAATPEQVLSAVICIATNGTITRVPTPQTPNRLLYLEASTLEHCLQ